jgi:hypothetical protein
LEQVLRGTSSTISVTFYVDGDPTDPSPDTATIRITRLDGSEVVASTAATNAGVGKFTFDLTPTHAALVDVLSASWTATFGGQSQTIVTQVEVVGGFYFAIAELRAKHPELSDPTLFPSDVLAEERAVAEDIIEGELACAVAFVPRVGRESVAGDGGPRLYLQKPSVRAIRSVTVNGTALTSGELAALSLDGHGLWSTTGWPSAAAWPSGWPSYGMPTWSCPPGPANIVVVYEHGLDAPPRQIKDAAMLLTSARALGSGSGADGVNPRATRIRLNDVGEVLLADPTAPGATTGIPEVDAAINDHSRARTFSRLR